MRKILALALAITLTFAIAIPVFAADSTIYLKGSGNNSFNKSGWQNVFYVGGSKNDTDPNVWHLVYTGNNFNAVSEMQITFTNGYVFKWNEADGPSLNPGGNNPGWVIAAPYDWEIAYVNKGNNNESGSFLVTSEGGNNNFNISNDHKGTPNPKPVCVKGSFSIKACVKQEIITQKHTPIYKIHKYGTLVSQANKHRTGDLYEFITGEFLNNGMTYLKINKAALAGVPNGVKIGIAESNKPGNKASAAWNTPIAPGQLGTGKDNAMTYTLKIVDNKLIVTSDLPGFGAQVYPGADENKIKGPADIKHNGVTEYNIPELKDGCFFFFFHIGSANYEGTEIIGCVRPGVVETKTKVYKPNEIWMVITGPGVNYAGKYTTKVFETPEAVKGAGASFSYEVKLYAVTDKTNPLLPIDDDIVVMADNGYQSFNLGTKTVTPPIVNVVCGYDKCPGPSQ